MWRSKIVEKQIFCCMKKHPFQKRLKTRLLPHMKAQCVIEFFFQQKWKVSRRFEKVTLHRAIKLLRISCELHMLMFNIVLFIYVCWNHIKHLFSIPIHSQHFHEAGKSFSHHVFISEIDVREWNRREGKLSIKSLHWTPKSNFNTQRKHLI